MVALSLSVVGAILAESTLSFFGYGAEPRSGPHDVGAADLAIEERRSSPATGGWCCSPVRSSC